MSGRPGVPHDRAVLTALNAASRHLQRWPSASVDRLCARRIAKVRPGRRNAVQRNKETSLQFWPNHFVELTLITRRGLPRRPLHS